MTGASPKRIYWDACCFVSYVAEDETRIDDLSQLMNDASAFQHEIYTSILSMVEVSFCPIEKRRRELSDQQYRKINNLWKPASPIKVVELFPTIATKAQELIRQKIVNGLALKPADAIHLATAAHMDVDVIHTYESRWSSWSEFLGIPIEQPKAEQKSFFDLSKTPETATPEQGTLIQ